MQAGLLDTYHRPASNRSPVAWALSGLLFTSYILLYFGPIPSLGLRFDVFQRGADLLRLGSKWTLYGLLYTAAMIGGGVVVLRRHGNSPYQRVRTMTVVAVQVVLAFALPLVMKVYLHNEYYFSYFWPLKIEYLYPSVVLAQPFLILAWSFLGSLVAFPLLAYFLGKRFYCSWVCGCGGLANTAGEPFRHLSSKTASAWRVEKVSIHTVLFVAVVTTAIVWVNWAIGRQHPDFALFAFRVQEWYGFAIGAMFAGVFGVGLYPLMGTRVWCRFGCPMAALLGLIQKFGRFRITVKKDMCISCGNCSTYCEMGIDVRAYAQANQDVKRAACVGCGMCAHMCPRGVLKLENKPITFKAGQPIRVYAVDLLASATGWVVPDRGRSSVIPLPSSIGTIPSGRRSMMAWVWSARSSGVAVLLALLLGGQTARLAAQVSADDPRAHKSVYGKLHSVDPSRKSVVMQSDDGKRLAWHFGAAVIAEAAQFKPGDSMIVIYRQGSPNQKRVTALAFPGTASAPTYVNTTGSSVVLRSAPAVGEACGAPNAGPISESTIPNGGRAEAGEACWCCAPAGETCTPGNKSGAGRALLVQCFK